MSGLLLVVLVVLTYIILFQIARSSEIIAQIQGEEAYDKKRNKYLSYSMIALMAVLFIGAYYCHKYLMPMMLPKAASNHGVEYDWLYNVTTILTLVVFFATHVMLFVFAYIYRRKEGKKPFHFAHNNRLEIVWTTVPALTLAILIALGLKTWFTMTSDAPKGSMRIEIVGKQFNWITRYPGKDGVLGKRYFTNINEKDNILGLDWKDSKTHDDIVIPNGELHLVKDKPVELIIGSRDVVHDVGLPHFRMKMDAVPGITSRMWFTPTITTEEMKEITGNPDFVYEIACDQMCGKGHYSMRGVVVVETQAEHDAWLRKQQSYYSQRSVATTTDDQNNNENSSNSTTLSMNLKK